MAGSPGSYGQQRLAPSPACHKRLRCGAAAPHLIAPLLLGKRPTALALTGIALALPAIVGVSASARHSARAVAAVTPLAAGIYLLTTTAWTLAERAVLARRIALPGAPNPEPPGTAARVP